MLHERPALDRRRLDHPALSPRLNELLGLLSIGAGTREIVASMHITPGVVSNYVGRIAERLGVPGAMRGRRVRLIIVRIAAHEAARRSPGGNSSAGG